MEYYLILIFFSDKISKNLYDLNQKSKLYTGYSVPYFEKEAKIKPKSEVLKSFSSDKKIKKKISKSQKKNTRKKTRTKKRKKKYSRASLEKRILYLEKEVKRLKGK